MTGPNAAAQRLGEQWEWVPGYEGHYEVSDLGRVRSYQRGRTKILGLGHGSYYQAVDLCVSGLRRKFQVHRLVLLAFVGPRPHGAVIRHLDGDHLNNHLENLCYGTQAENIQDSVRLGTQREVRKTHCPANHPYTGLNLIVSHDGSRRCRACQNVWQVRANEKRKRERAQRRQNRSVTK